MRQPIIRRVSAALLLFGFPSLPFAAAAQGQVTADQVDKAVEALEKLAQGQIEEDAVPGLAVAVVFQDKVIYAEGFGVKHFDRDVFTYATEGEMAIGTAGITFTLGADGKAIRVLVENLDAGGEGTFVRMLPATPGP